jgi:hypothetical protein
MNTFRLHEIEAPKGGRNKYKYDEALGRFRWRRVLP